MKQKIVQNPAGGVPMRQVALEPNDLAEMVRVLEDHLHWMSVAMDFLPDSDHLKQAVVKFQKMRQALEEVQRYGVPTELEE